MKPPSDSDMLQYPHTFITADHEWDPSILDDEYHHDEDSPQDVVLSKLHDRQDPHVDNHGDVDLMTNMFNALHDSDSSHNDTFQHNPIMNKTTTHELIVDTITLNPQDLCHKLPDLESFHPYFGWVGQYSLTYDEYFMMLQIACIRYDKTLKQKHSTTSRAVYQHELDDDPSIHDEAGDCLDDNFAPDGIDTPSDDIYNVHITNFKRTPHINHLFLEILLGNQNPTRPYLVNLGIMDLSTSPNVFTICLVKTSRWN